MPLVTEADEDITLVRGLVARSINTGHLWAQLPGEDFAASFRQTLGTAARKGHRRITESIRDTLDLHEKGKKEKKRGGTLKMCQASLPVSRTHQIYSAKIRYWNANPTLCYFNVIKQ